MMKEKLLLLKDKLKLSESLLIRFTFPILQKVWHIFKFLTDTRFRSERLEPLKFRKQYYQRSTYTYFNRYPFLFQKCTEYFSQHPSPKILSFGCSTGEEVRSLSEYMPNATIIGVDINKWCINECVKNNLSEKQLFFHAYSSQFEKLADFDAIFCMAVFQRTENRTNPDNAIATGFTFKEFEEHIGFLHAKLKNKGLFVIDHSDFSFTDTECSKHYQTLGFDNNRSINIRPQFDKNNIKTADSQFNYKIFVKKSEGISE